MWITAFRKPDLTSTACSTRRETTGCSSAASRVARRRSITGRLSKTWSLRRAIQLRRMAHLLCPKRPKWPCRTADPLSGAGCGAQHPRHHQVPLLAHDRQQPQSHLRLRESGPEQDDARNRKPIDFSRSGDRCRDPQVGWQTVGSIPKLLTRSFGICYSAQPQGRQQPDLFFCLQKAVFNPPRLNPLTRHCLLSTSVKSTLTNRKTEIILLVHSDISHAKKPAPFERHFLWQSYLPHKYVIVCTKHALN